MRCRYVWNLVKLSNSLAEVIEEELTLPYVICAKLAPMYRSHVCFSGCRRFQSNTTA